MPVVRQRRAVNLGPPRLARNSHARERHRAALQQIVDEWEAELRKPEAATLCCQAKLIEAKQQLAKHKWDSFTAAGQYGCCSQAVAGLQLFFPVVSRKWSCLRVAE